MPGAAGVRRPVDLSPLHAHPVPAADRRLERRAAERRCSRAEDEFAINNWAASVAAGRAREWRCRRLQLAFYDRYFDLDSLTPAELRRWQAYERAFVDKLSADRGGAARPGPCQSPAHMARVRYLSDLFPGAKFVHISRPPDRVFQSNLLLFRTLQNARLPCSTSCPTDS